MGLRCLLGHDFSEPRTERDREVRGDEVITTITEVKECRRCGETRVVSENKEVTSAGRGRADPGAAGAHSDRSTADGTDGVDGAVPDATPDASTPNAPASNETMADAPTPDESTPDATTADATPDERAVGSDGPPDGTVAADEASDGEATGDAATGDGTAAPEDGFDHPTAESADGAVDADVEEDAEIIDAEGDAGGQHTRSQAPESETRERGHGEWPDADANRRGEDPAGDDDPAPEDDAASEARTDVVPDAKRADEAGAAADPTDEDAEFIDSDGPGDWPERAGEDEGYDAELGGDDEGVSVDGNLTPQVDPEVTEQEDVEFIEADTEAATDERSAAPAAADDGRGAAGGDDVAGGTEPASDAGGTERGSNTGGSGPSASNVELQTTVDNVDTVYVCPDCGNNEPVGASSMRAGDICPECKRGYIEEREIR
ncbi:DUF7093 family protein [Halobaculum magnesiiphilum]|uniref:Uncharacterized protein n=1 Tax=Halobaculum magnesiiphilum TaxID=1017351 RepID=A0A8T8WB18_9EURY|nr:hypothetical protein [Halobaculum magnesiiphilum]QZP37028.1 hypothetical protein K6T50_12105 [Halobaculum magnesiiphilum]